MRYKTLPDVISDILTYNGAIVDKTDDGILDIIATPEISEILKMPEYARLIFSYGEVSNESIYASFDSEFFNLLPRLFADRGRFSVARFEQYIPNREKISKLIHEKISFGNATFRLERTETKDISYLLVYFRYTALSDEKREGIFPILINEMNLSTMLFENGVNELMEKFKEPDFESISPKIESVKVLQSAYAAGVQMVHKKLKDFIKSLERRLNRDIKRVYEYFETLKKETKTSIEEKAMKAIVSQEPNVDNGLSPEEGDKLLQRLNAIEAEQKWKIQDLIAKYKLNIKVEPTAVIRIDTHALIFWINIKRRLASRQFPVTYNPIIKQIDALPCESCFYPQEGYYTCDDSLHIVCGNCFKTCPHCLRKFCMACHKNICPKCKRKE